MIAFSTTATPTPSTISPTGSTKTHRRSGLTSTLTWIFRYVIYPGGHPGIVGLALQLLMMYCCTSPHHSGDSALIISLDPQDRRPLYLQIMDEVRRALVNGSLRSGDPLPSVRDLSSELVVNPRTVSQAYQELEREGVVQVRRGHGTFVATGLEQGAAEKEAFAQGLARRTILEARRSGLTVGELIAALRTEEKDEARMPDASMTGDDAG